MSSEAGQSAPANTSTILSTLDSELAHLEARMAELRRQRDEEANNKTREVQLAIQEFMKKVGAESVEDAIRILRNGSLADASKAKRLTPLVLKQMKYVLTKGATVAATAQYFKLSEATVNTRKKSFGLVGRKNVDPVPFAQAIKGMPQG